MNLYSSTHPNAYYQPFSHTSRLPSDCLVKLGCILLLFGEYSAHGHGGHFGFWTAHATRCNTIVFPRDLDGTTQWLHLRQKGRENVGYEVLLHYRLSGQSLNEACIFGNSYDPPRGINAYPNRGPII